jgi:hypothetical protein
VANQASGNVTVIDEQQVWPIPLDADITPLPGDVSGVYSPSFSFVAASEFAPFATVPDGLFFEIDTWQGPWTAATSQGSGNFSGAVTAPLQPGVHILYGYATDGQDATSTMGSIGSNMSGGGTSPLISDITAYVFLVSPPSASLSPSSLNFGNQLIDTTSVPQLVTLSGTGVADVTLTPASYSFGNVAVNTASKP